MLKPYPMSTVIIAGPNSAEEAVIRELHRLKVLHIVEHSKSELADIGKPLESAARLSEILVRIRAIMSALSIKLEEPSPEPKSNLLEIDSATKKLAQEVSLNNEELKKTNEMISRSESARQELELLKNLNVPLEFFAPYKSLACFTGFIKGKGIEALKEELPEATERYLISEAGDKKGFIALFVDVKSREQVARLLQKNWFVAVNLASIGSLKGSPLSNLKKVEGEIARLKRKNLETAKRLEKLAADYKEFLLAAEAFLGEQLEKAEVPLKFASTPSSFLVKGWVPDEELKEFIERLNKAAGNKVLVHFDAPAMHDKVPVKLNNLRYARAFEFFIDLYSMPTYREIDPTFFIFLTFPIFFGVMLGDIGYGMVSLAFFWLLRKKMPKAKNFFNILMLASFASMLFGFFFGEFFGYELIRPIISREHEMFTLMYIAIGVGVVHVNVGLIIGFVNELKSHGVMHAIYTKGSWILLEAGVAMLALSYFGKILISPWVGAVFLGASILMLFKGEGITGLIEIPKIFTNILSYVRLAAIGLSSLILAIITNRSATEFFHKGSFLILVGILILVTGHIVNIALGLLGSFLHSMRLHYVEFFSKFFHGGAEKYQPFGAKE